jgi:hypothetical protein
MGLDIRLPIGLLFTVIGLLLTGFGWFSDAAIYQKSLGININLWWGLVLTIFGIGSLLLSRRHTSAMHPSDTSVEGRATEARERETGLEGRNDKKQ